ncbi:hypothetical protein FNU76_18835 [Chitinimonas arctica]|uniref:Uncharacterized protein n=1 Tax=Chitinimonas arctica TaxID=2594795 RepID=A0A516SJC1_9NEIS|nr:hypothetical protein [Chitinimonas arctica]QDQ28237.1 hypothetical protein FNU76_18835 [Chitinimonas arctica]
MRWLGTVNLSLPLFAFATVATLQISKAADTEMAHEIQTVLVPAQSPAYRTSTTTMTWAKEMDTEAARYIGELGKDRRGYKSGCVCFGCGHPLSAVKAGAPPIQWSGSRQQRPHFAHQRGATPNNCLVITARIAALNLLRHDGLFQLPGRIRSGKFAGFSGTLYEASAEQQPENVTIRNVSIHDTDTALLKLEDGRLIRVKLISSINADDEFLEDAGVPTIILLTDDPDIAGMSPSEIRQRLTVGVQWCRTSGSDPLLLEAEAIARSKAETALDWYDFKQHDPSIPDALRYETLLHLKAKEILSTSEFIQLPAFSVTVSATLSDGSILSETEKLEPTQLWIKSATLEKRLGQLRPDLLVNFSAFPLFDAGQLIIEVTVSNPITPSRRDRIAALDIPALEIDLGRLMGAVTLETFTDLLVSQLEAKSWIHHPALRILEGRAQARLAERRSQIEVDTTVFNDARSKINQLSLKDLAHSIQLAAMTYAEAVAKAKIASGRNTGDASELVVERARQDVLAHIEALKLHTPRALDQFWNPRFQTMLNRLLSIKYDCAIGYNLNSAWQVINTIRSDTPQSQCFHSIYLLAIKIYMPTLNADQKKRTAIWRDKVAGQVQERSSNYFPDCRYNQMVANLFPELASGLDKLSKIRKNPSILNSAQSSSPAKIPGSPISAYSNESDAILTNGRISPGVRYPNLHAVNEAASIAAQRGLSPVDFANEYAHSKRYHVHDVMNAILETGLAKSAQRWK